MKIDVIIPTLGRRPDGLARMIASVERHSPGVCCIVANETGPREYAYIIHDLIKRSDADVVIWGGDSCEWTSDCAGAVARAFTRHLPDLDGCCGLNPTNLRPWKDNIYEFCFMAIGRRFWERFPDDLCMCPYYRHFWVDTELGLLAKSVGKFRYLPEATLLHPLPETDGVKVDDTHQEGRRHERMDNNIRRARAKAGLLWGSLSTGRIENTRRERLKRLGKDAAKWSIFQNDSGADAAMLRFLDGWFPNRYNLHILEIGTCRGVSACILAERGHVTTLDVCPYPETQAVIDTFAMGERVTRILGPSASARALLEGKRFDVVFVDGMHEYEAFTADWDFAVTKAPHILCHDYCDQHPGVQRAVNELKAQGVADWECRDTFAAATLLTQ